LAIMTQYLVGECKRRNCSGRRDGCYKYHSFLKHQRVAPQPLPARQIPKCIDEKTVDGYHPNIYKTNVCSNTNCPHGDFCMYIHHPDEDVEDETRDMALGLYVEATPVPKPPPSDVKTVVAKVVKPTPVVKKTPAVKPNAPADQQIIDVLNDQLNVLKSQNQILNEQLEASQTELRLAKEQLSNINEVIEQIMTQASIDSQKMKAQITDLTEQLSKQRQLQVPEQTTALTSKLVGSITGVSQKWKQFLQSDKSRVEFSQLRDQSRDQMEHIKSRRRFLQQQLQILDERELLERQLQYEMEEYESAPEVFKQLSVQLKESSARMDSISNELEALDELARKAVPSRFSRRVALTTSSEQDRLRYEALVEQKLGELALFERDHHLPIIHRMLNIARWLPLQEVLSNHEFIQEVQLLRDRLSGFTIIEKLFENLDQDRHAAIMKHFRLHTDIIQLNKSKFIGEASVSTSFSQISILLGKAFKAKPVMQNRWVVLKQYPIQITTTSDLSKTQKDALLQCFKEIYALSKLTHPNVIVLEQYFLDPDLKCMVLQFPYLQNGTLREYLEQKQLSFEDKVEIMKQLLNALIYLHSKGIIHRDINWNNILIGELGQPIIADFDISKDISSQLSITTTIGAKGTAGYMAPEIQTNDPLYSEKSDIFALGVTMLKLFFPQVNETSLVNSDNIDQLLPSSMSTNEKEAVEIIKYMLNSTVDNRPDANELGSHSFFSRSIISYFAHDRRIVDKIMQSQENREKLKSLKSRYLGKCHLAVDRSNIVHTLLGKISSIPDSEWFKATYISFQREYGADAGGLSREAFSLLFKHVSDSQSCDLFSNNGGCLLPGVDQSNHSKQFGRVLARMLLHGMKMTCNLHIIVYEFLVGNDKTIAEYFKHESHLSRLTAYISMYDESVASQMRDIVIYGIDQVFGDVGAELNDGTRVTKSTEKKYIMERIFDVLLNGKLKQLQQLRRGLTSCPEIARIVDSMSAYELKIELEASLDITPAYVIDRLNIHSSGWSPYGGNSASAASDRTTGTDLIQVLKQFDTKHLCMFIMFCTGQPNLDESDTIRVVRSASSVANLPTSHTCVKQLQLPDYCNINVLKDKLMTAIQADSGFGFM